VVPTAPPATPPPSTAGASLVLVVGDAVNLDVGDDDMLQFFEDLGFRVDVADEQDRARDFNRAQLVVISSSANANQIGNDYDLDLPVLVMNANMFDDMSLVQGRGAGQVQARDIEIIAPQHPLAAGLNGRVNVSSFNSTVNFGVPDPSATIIATVSGDPNRAVIFAYDKGAQLPAGNSRAGAARERRVAFFLRENQFDRAGRDVETLLEAAVYYTYAGQAVPSTGVPGRRR
jgi:hypothetical protein